MLATWPAASWCSSSFKKLRYVCKSFPSLPCSSGCKRFHSTVVHNNSFLHGRQNLQGMEGDMIARGSGQRWQNCLCKKSSVGHLLMTIAPPAGDATCQRPTQPGSEAWRREANITQCLFLTSFYCWLNEDLDRMSRKGSWLASPFSTGEMKGVSSTGSFVMLQSAASRRQSTHLVHLSPPSSFLTSLRNDSIGKMKERICCRWQGPQGNTTPLLPSSLGEQTFAFSLTL